MLGFSKVQIIGNLGGTPEMKYLPSGDHVVNFSVAVNRRFKDREDNPKEVTDWYRICAFNGVGAACANHLQKGGFRCEPSSRETANRRLWKLCPRWCGFWDLQLAARTQMASNNRHSRSLGRAQAEAQAKPKAQTEWIPMICPSNVKITFPEAAERPAGGF